MKSGGLKMAALKMRTNNALSGWPGSVYRKSEATCRERRCVCPVVWCVMDCCWVLLILTWVKCTGNISVKLQLLLQSLSYNYSYTLNHGGQIHLQLLLKECN